MSAFAISYVVLWVLVVVLVVVLLGALRELAALRTSRAPAGGSPVEIPALEDDGPNLGDPLPAEIQEAWSRTEEGESEGTTLAVVVMNTVCSTCTDLVPALNRSLARPWGGRSLVLLQGSEALSEAFLKLFPLALPTLHDPDYSLAGALHVHHIPSCLIYARDGRLAWKRYLGADDDALEAVAVAESLSQLDRLSAVETLGAG